MLEFENGHAPSVDGIRSSTEYRSLEKASYCAEPEITQYRRETEIMYVLQPACGSLQASTPVPSIFTAARVSAPPSQISLLIWTYFVGRVQLIQEGRDHIRNDNDQRLRLEQAATKTIEEKLELVEVNNLPPSQPTSRALLRRILVAPNSNLVLRLSKSVYRPNTPLFQLLSCRFWY